MKRVIRNHQDLRVWRRAQAVLDLCRGQVERFPEEGQPVAIRVRKLAESAPFEIERGFHYRQLAPYLHHLNLSRHAVERLEPVIIEACERGWFDREVGDQVLARTAEIQRMLRKLMETLEASRLRKGRWLVAD